MLLNGFGGHRIEGIGDKHVPWIHNMRNTDMLIAADDEDCVSIIRLFNEPAGRKYLKGQGVPQPLIDSLDLVGISGAGNITGAIKFAKWYELTSNDIVLTVLTDSMEPTTAASGSTGNGSGHTRSSTPRGTITGTSWGSRRTI